MFVEISTAEMAESTADATADTLTRELKKILTEIFYDGGGSKDSNKTDGSFGVLKSIDVAATKILTCLTEVESKKPESDIPSSPKKPESDIPLSPKKPESDIPSSPKKPESEIPSSPKKPESDIPSLPKKPESDIPSSPKEPESDISSSLKKPESDVPSSSSSPKVEVPKEFICTLSNTIMIEPVVIASGQTYEKNYITRWLMYEDKCPKTKQVLSHRLWTPNHLIDELITNWCQVNNYERPRPSDETVIGLFRDDIDSLLQRVSSPSSLEDQINAANELRRQTKRFANVRAFFISEIHDSLTRLLTPLSELGEEVNWYPKLQRNIITTLFNISTLERNKTVISEHPLAIPLLTKSLKQGTVKTRRNSAAALLSLSDIGYNKIFIGTSDTLNALIDLIEEGDYSAATEAAYAFVNLCDTPENKDRAVSKGLISVLINKIKAGRNVDHLLSVLAFMSTHDRTIEQMEDLGFIEDLFSIFRKPSSSLICENLVAIVSNMCSRSDERDGGRITLKVVDEEENKYGTFTKLAKQGSVNAEEILRWLKKYGTGKEPQRG